MDQELNNIIQGHEINENLGLNVPSQQNRTFRRSNAVIIFWTCMLIFWGLVLLVGVINNDHHTDGGMATLWFLIILETVFMFKILGAYLTTITIGENSLISRSGVIFRHKREVPYIQISNVESSSFLGLGSIKITLLNNNVFQYKYVQHYEEAEQLINESIRQSRLKVQVSEPIYQPMQ